MKGNLVDRLVSYVSPQAGLRRMRARTTLDMVRRSYEGAKRRRANDDWSAASTGPNNEIGQSLIALRNRARELVRDNPIVTRVVDLWPAHAIGDGITATFADQAGKGSGDRQDLWDRWADSTDCDADGQANFYGLQALAVAALVESGEVLIRLLSRRPEDYPYLRVPLQLQVLEADFLDHTRNGAGETDGGYIVQGVEFDKRGRRVAYWLFGEHPGEFYLGRGRKISSVRVGAEDIVHVYRKRRPGQVRGVTWLHPVITLARDLDDYHQALRMKAKVEACFSAFVTRPDAEGTPLAAPASGDPAEPVEELEPGWVQYLKQGEEVAFADPSNSSGHTLLSKTWLMFMAVGCGLTYDQLSGDLSGANYSSLRAGKVEFRRILSALQWHLLIPGLCEPVRRRFVIAARTVGEWRGEDPGAEWMPPATEPVDPLKDLQATVKAIRSGLMTLPQGMAAMGYNPRRQVEAIAAFNKILDDHGLVLDTDPRRVSNAGVGQFSDPLDLGSEGSNKDTT